MWCGGGVGLSDSNTTLHTPGYSTQLCSALDCVNTKGILKENVAIYASYLGKSSWFWISEFGKGLPIFGEIFTLPEGTHFCWPKCFTTKLFWPKLFGPTFDLNKKYLTPKYFGIPNFVWPPKKFGQNFLGPLSVLDLIWLGIIILFYPIFFGPNLFLDPHVFEYNICLDSKYCWTQNFFGPNIFFNQILYKLYWLKCFLDIKLFRSAENFWWSALSNHLFKNIVFLFI